MAEQAQPFRIPLAQNLRLSATLEMNELVRRLDARRSVVLLASKRWSMSFDHTQK